MRPPSAPSTAEATELPDWHHSHGHDLVVIEHAKANTGGMDCFLSERDGTVVGLVSALAMPTWLREGT
ncbi:hypothetical protein [Streptomyces enissocaesilis]|uniref:Acetyltransferase n=1 Tax=Streptomyces enissocaesilis TaxID=332589 RepID=A0ABN3XGD6_9ACTN